MHIISKLQRFCWRVGDECFKMNHRCNYKSLSSLQRWGWRVAELYENLFFLNSDFSFFTFHFLIFHFSLTLPPFHLRFKSVSGPFQNGEQIGGKWDLHRIYKGGRRELHRNEIVPFPANQGILFIWQNIRREILIQLHHRKTTLLLKIRGLICFVGNLDNMKTYDEMSLCKIFKTS